MVGVSEKPVRILRANASTGVSYEYDGLGHRVRTVDGVPGVVVEYAYVGDTLVAECRGNDMRELKHDQEESLTIIREALEKLPPTRRPFGVSAVEATHEAFYDADLSSTLALIELWWEMLKQHYQQFEVQSWLAEVNIVNPTLVWTLDTEDSILETHATVLHEGESSAIPWGWLYVRRRNQQMFRICVSTPAYLQHIVRFYQTIAETPESELHKVFAGDHTVIVIDSDNDDTKFAHPEGGSAEE